MNEQQEYLKMVFNEDQQIQIKNFEGLKYAASLTASIGWTAKQTMEALDKMPENGARAGTSLRYILTKLIDIDKEDEILVKYNISKYNIDPRCNSFEDILRVFIFAKVTYDDIEKLFGIAGENFSILMDRYMNKITKEAIESRL